MNTPNTARSLPERPNIEQLRNQAKDLRKSAGLTSLSQAQLALAREYGFASWPKLIHESQMRVLRHLIEDGEPYPVKAFLEKNPRLAHESFSDGQTPLMRAAEENRPLVVEVIAAFNPDFDARFAGSHHTALSWALTSWSLDAAHKLVELGAKPDLFCAAGLGLVNLLPSFWVDGQLIDQPSQTGSSRYGSAGNRLPLPGKEGQLNDALYIACRTGQLEASRFLLEHGADPNWKGFAGATCLAWAEFSGQAGLGELLRGFGGSDDIVDDVYQATPKVFPLMILAGWGFAWRLAKILEGDPSLIGVRSPVGTPLHAAAMGGQIGSGKALVKAGAETNALNENGQTAADLARAKGEVGFAEWIEALG